MRPSARDTAFEEYVAARQAVLLRFAYLLCGDWHRAEDATASALAKLYVHWPRIRTAGAEVPARPVGGGGRSRARHLDRVGQDTHPPRAGCCAPR